MEITIELNEVEYDYRLWNVVQKKKNENLNSLITDSFFFNDLQTSRYISKYFKGYMIKPAAIIDTNVQLEAKTRAVHSLEELEQGLIEQSETHDLYLFELMYFPAIPTYVTVDTITFEPITLDKPELRGGGWKIRYASVEKN